MEDYCVCCGEDITELGTHYCKNCAEKSGLTLCKKGVFFVDNEYSNVGYCTMHQHIKLNFDTCDKAEKGD